MADEDFPPSSTRRLREAGHDVAATREDAPGSDDPAVLARATRELRILLTSDRDYGELIFHHAHPAPLGVVYFRLGSDDPEAMANWILDWLAAGRPPLEGWFTVVRGNKVRRRRLP